MTYPNSVTRFSQCGEDGVLCWLFNGKREGFYVDVGCHDHLDCLTQPCCIWSTAGLA